jgi:hypothetical protein
MANGQRVVLDLTIYNADGSVFDKVHKDSPNVPREGVHLIQRTMLNALSAQLDNAEKRLAEKAAA